MANQLTTRAIGWPTDSHLSALGLCETSHIMFCFAGVARFTDLRNDYAAMIPDPLPDGMWVIYLTGLLEIAGGLGLLLPDWRRRAGICLVLFLIAIFPANVNAALRDIPFGGAPPTPLPFRTMMQLVLLPAVWWSAVRPTPRT